MSSVRPLCAVSRCLPRVLMPPWMMPADPGRGTPGVDGLVSFIVDLGFAGDGAADRGFARPAAAERGLAGDAVMDRGLAGDAVTERGLTGDAAADRGLAGDAATDRGLAGDAATDCDLAGDAASDRDLAGEAAVDRDRVGDTVAGLGPGLLAEREPFPRALAAWTGAPSFFDASRVRLPLGAGMEPIVAERSKDTGLDALLPVVMVVLTGQVDPSTFDREDRREAEVRAFFTCTALPRPGAPSGASACGAASFSLARTGVSFFTVAGLSFSTCASRSAFVTRAVARRA